LILLMHKNKKLWHLKDEDRCGSQAYG
jgi:hypothetical protein